MNLKRADNFFNDVDYVSIVSNIKDLYASSGVMSILLDFERVLDQADLYAYKNWELGELVNGPDVGRYTVKCTFMWPKNLMPDPRGSKRLLAIGCKLVWAKSKIRVPIEVKDYEDFVPGTKYPRGIEKPVWFVEIEMPIELMDEIKEGSIDLAGKKIDLDDLDEAYDDDLEKGGAQQDSDQIDNQQQMANPMSPTAPGAPM